MTELVSLVIVVRPVEPVTLPGHLGRAAYALLLRWLSEYDPTLAQRWHDDEGLKPFTCSSLVGTGKMKDQRRALTPDRIYWLRLTSFDPEVSAALLARQAAPPPDIELDGVRLSVERIISDSTAHPWAGTSSYEPMASPYLLARQSAPRRIQLAFNSPVAFHQRHMNMPIPLPDLVFGGLAERWNAFSPIAISPEVRRYCDECVAINGFQLRSRAVPMKEGSLQIGAVGEATYVAVTFDRYWMSVLALLADFAFYAGVGRLTTTGMGQAKRLNT